MFVLAIRNDKNRYHLDYAFWFLQSDKTRNLLARVCEANGIVLALRSLIFINDLRISIQDYDKAFRRYEILCGIKKIRNDP